MVSILKRLTVWGQIDRYVRRGWFSSVWHLSESLPSLTSVLGSLPQHMLRAHPCLSIIKDQVHSFHSTHIPWCFFFFFKLQTVFFSWRIIALQCCIDFCHMTTWISHNYIYIPSPLSLLFPIFIYVESRKRALMNLFPGKKWRCRHRAQTCGHSGGRRRRDELRGSIDIHTLACVG